MQSLSEMYGHFYNQELCFIYHVVITWSSNVDARNEADMFLLEQTECIVGWSQI